MVNSASDKLHVQGLMRLLEQQSIGSNTRATRKLLEMVYERRDRGFMSPGHAFHVDWIGISEEMGQQIVNFGF